MHACAYLRASARGVCMHGHASVHACGTPMSSVGLTTWMSSSTVCRTRDRIADSASADPADRPHTGAGSGGGGGGGGADAHLRRLGDAERASEGDRVVELERRPEDVRPRQDRQRAVVLADLAAKLRKAQ
jgi:hypothetical protein